MPGSFGPLGEALLPLVGALLVGLVTLRRVLPRGLPAAMLAGVLTGLAGGTVAGRLARWLAGAGGPGGAGALMPPGGGIPGRGDLLSAGALLVHALALGAALRCWRVPLFELVVPVVLLPALAGQLLVVSGVLPPPPFPLLHLLPPVAFMLDVRSWSGGVPAPAMLEGAAVWGLQVAGFLAVAAWGMRASSTEAPGSRTPQPEGADSDGSGK